MAGTAGAKLELSQRQAKKYEGLILSSLGMFKNQVIQSDLFIP